MKASELKKGIKKPEPVKKPEATPEKARKPKRIVKRELLGEMIGKDKQIVYDKQSPHYKSVFYKVKTRNIENMENDAPAVIYAFKETIINPEECPTEKDIKRKEEVWRIIENSEYLGKRYIIYCY